MLGIEVQKLKLWWSGNGGGGIKAITMGELCKNMEEVNGWVID